MQTRSPKIFGTIQNDLDAIARDANIPWADLANTSVLVTGATGLLGSLTCKALLHFSALHNMPLRVVAQVRDSAKAEGVFADVAHLVGQSLFFLQHDILQPFTYEAPVDYLVHAAAPTSSAFMVTHPVETLLTIINGTQHVLELAQGKAVRSVLFLSSLEIYGQLAHEKVQESDYGYVDLLSARASYPVAKRCAETLCTAWWHEHKLPVKIARLAQTLGPGVTCDDQRVFAQFARAVLEGKNIELVTKGETCRDYLYTADAIRGLLTILLKGENGQAYNLSNEATYCSIREMAELCASMAPGTRVVVNESDASVYAPHIKISLDTRKVRALGYTCSTTLHDMFKSLL